MENNNIFMILIIIILICIFPTIWYSDERYCRKIRSQLDNLIYSIKINTKIVEPFLYGVSTSSYQNEGGNWNSDWAEWEKDNVKLPCNKTCNGWDMMKDDLDKLISLGVNSYRFSIEWGRLMPSEDVWDKDVAKKYRRFVKKLKKNNITPFCTLLHFTLPSWLKGGLESPKFVNYFLDFTQKVLELFGNDIKYYLTFNEPMLWIVHSYLRGTRPPCKKDNEAFEKAVKNIFKGHEKAYQLIHSHSKNKKVSISQNVVKYSPKNKWSVIDNVMCYIVNKIMNYSFLDAFATGNMKMWFPNTINLNYSVDNIKSLDYIGLNHYNDALIGFSYSETVDVVLNHGNFVKSDMDWSFVPESLYYVCKDVYKKYELPIYITENGFAGDDKHRQKFLKYSKATILLLKEQNIPIRSYMYWTFCDNWEWEEGRINFGLYKTNYDELYSSEKRLTPKDSVNVFKKLFT